MGGIRLEMFEDEELLSKAEDDRRNKEAYCITSIASISENAALFKIIKKLYEDRKYRTLLTVTEKPINNNIENRQQIMQTMRDIVADYAGRVRDGADSLSKVLKESDSGLYAMVRERIEEAIYLTENY